jgi:diguanylate cyclase (GGDEF)-like protein
MSMINDTYGHPAGDTAIEGIGRIIRLCFPAPFTPGRIGGDEFGVLLPGCDIETATGIAESLRRIVAAQAFGDPPIRATLSIGVAELAASPLPIETYAAADQALYRAKRKGRNFVETSGGIALPVRSCARRPEATAMAAAS